MAIVYVSPGLATGNNDGTTAADAFQSWTAFATAGCAAGSDVRVNAGEASTSAVTLTSNINGSIAAGFTTITGYSTDWTTPTLRQRDGDGSGANTDGFILNGLQYVWFNKIGAKRYTRDGERQITTICKYIVWYSCQMDNNGAYGFNNVSPYLNGLYISCKANNNATGGFNAGYPSDKYILCEAATNGIGFNLASAGGNPSMYFCIARNNTTGIHQASTTYGHIYNCVIDANTTGITIANAVCAVAFVGNRITNSVTTAVAWGTAAVIEVGLWNHFYNNAADHTGANGLYVQNTNNHTAADPYTNQAGGVFKNKNTATLYQNIINVGIDNTNITNLQAGLTRAMDYPALTNLRDNDTADGDTGTLSSDKILKSNPTAGNYNDDNLSVGNVRPVAFGIGQTGDLSNLDGTEAAYVALEETRNSGASADIIKIGETITQKSIDYVGEYGGGGITVPDTPTNVAATAYSDTAIDLTCDMVDTATDIKWYECSNAAGDNPSLISPTFIDGMRWRHTVTAGTTHYYKAKATNSAGDSIAYSSVVFATSRSTAATEQTLWSTFKTKMQADSYLSTYIQKWKFDREAKILSETKFPIFKAWITDVEDYWKAVPKNKIAKIRIVIHFVVYAAVDLLEAEKLKADEYIRNAIETDMTFAGGVTMNILGPTVFTNLDDTKAQGFLELEVLSNRFTAGER